MILSSKMKYILLKDQNKLSGTYVSLVQRIIIGCGLIVVILGIFVTYSRIAWFLALIVILAYLIRHISQRKWLKTATLCLIGIVSIQRVKIPQNFVKSAAGVNAMNPSVIRLT